MIRRLLQFLGILCLLATGGHAAGGAADTRVVVFGTGHRTIPRGAPMVELDNEAYSQDLIDIVAPAAGLKYRIVEKDSFPELMAALMSGEIDVMPTVARIPEREGKMLLSVPHVHGTLVIVTPAGRVVTSADLATRRIAAMRDTRTYSYLQQKGWLEHVVIVNNEKESMEAVLSGRADATIINQFTGISLISRLGLKDRLVIAQALPDSVTDFCMAVRLEDGPLLAQLNDGLFLAERNGQLKENFEKWFGRYNTPTVDEARYRRWLVVGIGSAVLVALLAWGWGRYRLRQARKRTEEIERLVEVRTHELAAANVQLGLSEEKFSKAFLASPDSFSISELESGRLIDVNEGFSKLFGFGRAEVVGRSAVELGLWSSPADRDELVAKVRAQGGVRDLRMPIRNRNGETRAGLISVERITIGGRECMVLIIRDITDRERLEEQLRQAQRMESIGQLAGGVAHDFNNILTVIQCNASLLLSEDDFPPAYNEPVEQILQSTKFAASLTRQLLVFSRKQVIQRTSLDVAGVIQQTSRLLRRVIGEDIALEVQLPADLPPIFADEGMIEQVLLNLAVNARDAMPRGGRLTLAGGTAEPDEAYRRRIPQALAGHYVYLAVSDTGTGIAAGIMPKIFEPFFTTKEVGKGTGLGLATVYAIAQQHKGWIEVDSAVDRGTTFRVYFPRMEQAGAAGARPAAAHLTPGSETILVVEDNELVRASNCRILQRAGYQVFEAPSGEAALRVWAGHRERISLVVTDVVMPGGMTGRDLIEELRRDRPELKAIFTSGYSSDILGRDFVRTAANCFLAKPFEPSELTRLVHECLHPA